MGHCRYHEVCGLHYDADPGAGLCILHSEDPGKDRDRFVAALNAHRKKNGDDFTRIVFPDRANFGKATFNKKANFYRATFCNETDFSEATFHKEADFNGATFTEKASFIRATFKEEAYFDWIEFPQHANFYGATFCKEASFYGAKFTGGADFTVATFTERATFVAATFTKKAFFAGAKFLGGGDFQDTSFKEETVDFRFSSFQGRSLFIPAREDDEIVPIFSGLAVDFRQVVIAPLDGLIFRDADMQKCRFEDTDLRKVEMTGVLWPQIGGRFGVYDEIAPLETGVVRPWDRIERLYRELKQNYEDRRDYERAGDFHYGEKEMRRRNPRTPVTLCLFLALYRMFSGYGERYLRPLIWAGVLLLVSTICYLVLGLSPREGESTLALTNQWDWLRAAHYSFRVMTLLRPTDLVPLGYAKLVNTIQTILGPLFLGLFALAVRQRLRR